MSKSTAIKSHSRNSTVRSSRLVNLLWVFVVEGRTQEVIEQEKRSPPHLGLLPSILKFFLIKNSETEDRKRVNALWWMIPGHHWLKVGF